MTTIKIKRVSVTLLLCLITTFSTFGQQENSRGLIGSKLRGLEYQLKAGFNVGGITPLPIPAEIRSIEKYSPNLSLSISGEVSKWFGNKNQWALITGITLDTKSMTTEAIVKNYGMEIIGDQGEKVAGQWTGGVKTKVKNSYITLPIMAGYKISSRWKLKGGTYFSYLFDGVFNGHVYEGYLREGDPTGEKVVFSDGKIATYDFSTDLRRFQWGLILGGEWKAYKHLNVYGDLTWGLNDAFKKDFNTITFAMYPIYLNLGFGYIF